MPALRSLSTRCLILVCALSASACLAATPAPVSSVAGSVPDPDALTPAHAAAIFDEVAADCGADHGRLWGVSLCGPVMFVDARSHHIITNQADAEGKLRKAAHDVFVGTLPADQPVANTATEWAGVRWTQLLWPLPDEAAARHTLLAHESFHRVQARIAPLQPMPDNAQLDALYGRYTMQLEWRALDAALAAGSDAEVRQAATDALLFRAARYRRYPKARHAEVTLERNEGLAEYTGVMVGNRTHAQRLTMARRDLQAHVDDQSFVRSFAYATGPAYGLLLNHYAQDWRKHVASGRGLAAMLASALDLYLEHMPVDMLEARAAAYAGPGLLASETARKARRDREMATYRELLVDGPVLSVPMQHMQVQFDPRTLLPLGDRGTVYPAIRVRDDWGSIEVENGALIVTGWKRLTVSAPSGPAQDGTLHGDGWTLHLAPGWHVAPATRPGDVTLRSTDN